MAKAPAFNDVESYKLMSALAVLDPDELPHENPVSCPYYHWLFVGMAIHALGWGDKGLEIFDAWSSRSEFYDGDEVEAKWDSFDDDRANKVTVGTIFMWAKSLGWVMPRRFIPGATAFSEDDKPEIWDFDDCCEDSMASCSDEGGDGDE